MRIDYEYAVVRLLPHVERGEFVNVGVLLYCKRKRFAGIRWDLDASRIQAWCPDLDLHWIEKFLISMQAICAGAKEGGPLAQLEQPERFRWLTANRSTMIQCSPVHIGMTDDPEKTLEELFSKLVLVKDNP